MMCSFCGKSYLVGAKDRSGLTIIREIAPLFKQGIGVRAAIRASGRCAATVVKYYRKFRAARERFTKSV